MDRLWWETPRGWVIAFTLVLAYFAVVKAGVMWGEAHDWWPQCSQATNCGGAWIGPHTGTAP